MPTTMRRIVITGGEGQLARAIREVASGTKNEYITLSHRDADICNREMIEQLVKGGVDIVINCAAYTNVDGAEESVYDAERINTYGVEILAELCAKYGVRLVHISTDFVFGGDDMRRTPYRESDPAHPVNVYGRTKLDGERRALSNPDSIIIRTSWLYAPWGKNFVRTILRLARNEGYLRVVDDQYGSPTSALALARLLVDSIESGQIDSMSGIYHFANRGETTWYDFARAIVELSGVKCRVDRCSTAERPSKAQRPAYSALDCHRIESECQITISPWREALEECINLIRLRDE